MVILKKIHNNRNQSGIFRPKILSGCHSEAVCFVLYLVCISLDVCSIFSLTRAIPYLPLTLLARYHSRILIGSNTYELYLTYVRFVLLSQLQASRAIFRNREDGNKMRRVDVINSSCIKYHDIAPDNRHLNWSVLIMLLLSIINTKRFSINEFLKFHFNLFFSLLRTRKVSKLL